ncbi:29 kDa ribonucleoprotein A, chloroplastic-like protein [Tanacetum coccineum]
MRSRTHHSRIQNCRQQLPVNQESPMLLNHNNRAGARTFTRQTAAHHRGPHCCASDAQPIHLRDLNGQQPAASNNKSFSVIYYKVNGTSRGFGFVTMSFVEEVEEAVRNFNGYVCYEWFNFKLAPFWKLKIIATYVILGVAHANRKRKLMRGRYKILKWMCLGDEMGAGLGEFGG